MSEILKGMEALIATAHARHAAEAREELLRDQRTQIEAARDRGEMSEREARRALATLAPEPYRSESLAAIAAEDAAEQAKPEAPAPISPAPDPEPAKAASKAGKRRS